MADTFSTFLRVVGETPKQVFTLSRHKHKPGQAVQRFGNWRAHEPTVIIENNVWVGLGKPDSVKVVIDAY